MGIVRANLDEDGPGASAPLSSRPAISERDKLDNHSSLTRGIVNRGMNSV